MQEQHAHATESRFSQTFGSAALAEMVREVSFNAADLDLGYEGAFPFLTEPEGCEG